MYNNIHIAIINPLFYPVQIHITWKLIIASSVPISLVRQLIICKFYGKFNNNTNPILFLCKLAI